MAKIKKENKAGRPKTSLGVGSEVTKLPEITGSTIGHLPKGGELMPEASPVAGRNAVKEPNPYSTQLVGKGKPKAKPVRRMPQPMPKKPEGY